jgi:hypothetical protein
MARAREALTTHRVALDAISIKLAEVETLEREQYEILLKQYGVEIKDAFKAKYGHEKEVGDPSSVLV